LDGASLSKYPKGWQGYRNIHGNSFSPLENSIFFVKWEAVRYAFDLGYDWTLLTDLDTIVTNPNVSFRAYTALADEEARSHGRPKSVLVVDRYGGSPNAGCAMVRNDPAGRAFLRETLARWWGPWFQEDNGAFADAVIRAAAAAVGGNASSIDFDVRYQDRMAALGMPFGARTNRSAVVFLFGPSGAGPRLVWDARLRPFCVRHESDSEPFFQAGDWFVHGKNVAVGMRLSGAQHEGYQQMCPGPGEKCPSRTDMV
jgi:hypothetical protein